MMKNLVHQRYGDLVDGNLLFGRKIFEQLAVTLDFIAAKFFERVTQLHDRRYDFTRLHFRAERLDLEVNDLFGVGAYPGDPQRDAQGRITYGRFTAALPPRQAQLALRFSF